MPDAPPPDRDVYRLLVDAAADYAIYLIDPAGRIATWNAGAKAIKGYSAEEAIGQPFSMVFTEEDRGNGLPERALETARRTGRFESEGWRVRKDGTRFWALAVIDAVRNEAGEFVGFAKITRDMTERRQAQQALLESERRFRLLVQGVTDYAIFMLNPDGRVANWNAGARRIKGYEEGEIVGQHFSRFYTEEDRAAGVPRRALGEVETTGRFEAEGWRVRKDGTRFWANVVIDAIRDESGALIGFAKVTRDLSERREAQIALEEMRAQLAHSQKLEALGQLTGGVAHDFNNIMHVITAGLAMLDKLPANSEKRGQIRDEMRNATARAQKLTSQLLAYARRAPIKPELVETVKAIHQAIGLFSRSLPVGILSELSVADDLWPIEVDLAQFETALLNLAVNARDALGRAGTLRVSARNEVLSGTPQGLYGRFVRISVQDDGVGIPAEVLTRVFEPFFTTKPAGSGTGLGLSQVHGFVQQAGGAVDVISVVGKGTEVILFLPAAVAAGVQSKTEKQKILQSAMAAMLRRKLRVLVVDDEPAVSRLTVAMLEGSGHEVTATADAAAALRLLEDGQTYDLLLSDIVMPGNMNGLALAREVRRRWPKQPVLLATGYAGDAAEFGREFQIIYKPFTAIELSQALAMTLRRASQEASAAA